MMALSNTASRLFGKFAHCAFPTPVQRLINKIYAMIFKIDLSDFAPLQTYPTLNALFTRELKTPRPLNQTPNALLSPCDGVLKECGLVQEGQVLQIKGMPYLVGALLGSPLEESYRYFNLYLSPRDYHRFHAPCDLEVLETRYFSGLLFPVNESALKKHPHLFVCNERVVIVAKDPRGALLYFVAVGALNVGQIVLNFDSTLHTNAPRNPPLSIKHYDPPIALAKGAELGRFEMGSTIVLFVRECSMPPETLWHQARYGEFLSTLHPIGAKDA
ncbi:phosphatidylserine decarboxylase [Helicobacter baculiformis]|uniref:phosphatidylserine decarboxylase n=2 Tax=Helicobacter baculiformis TaxID=427351 RepID=A0ABV7ZEK9_9HELI